jgi:ribulose-phosphate 3-epimerase
LSVRIAPSILAADFARLADQIALVEGAGADQIHVDVMDGHFVPNITIGPPVVTSLRKATGLPLDVHLMIEAPDRYLEDFASAGADNITVHAEASRHLHRTLTHIRKLGKTAGVAINPATPLSVVADVVGLFDLLLVMSVNPGFGGQEFIEHSYEKIAAARDLLAGADQPVAIEVDGGVDVGNAAALVASGATVLVAGAAIFRTPDPAAATRALRAAAGR